jgi:glycosyltransferase involved in cell wall biosynthesis
VRFHALLLTRNEEQQLPGCLSSLGAAESVVVVDSGSTDGTLALLVGRPRTRVIQRAFTDFADQRNFGLATFAPDAWVLHLDADERLTPALADELRVLEPPADVVAYNVASRTFLAGRPVLRAAGFPVYQTRLTRAGHFVFEQVGHGQKAPGRYGVLPRLREPYDHHPFDKGWDAWRSRHEAYARQEVAAIRASASHTPLRRLLSDPIARRQWLSRRSARLPIRPELVWFYLMFVRRGLLDGRPGWEYVRRRWLYERLLRTELKRSGTW